MVSSLNHIFLGVVVLLMTTGTDSQRPSSSGNSFQRGLQVPRRNPPNRRFPPRPGVSSFGGQRPGSRYQPRPSFPSFGSRPGGRPSGLPNPSGSGLPVPSGSGLPNPPGSGFPNPSGSVFPSPNNNLIPNGLPPSFPIPSDPTRFRPSEFQQPEVQDPEQQSTTRFTSLGTDPQTETSPGSQTSSTQPANQCDLFPSDRLRCFVCKLDFKRDGYDASHPCLGRNGRNVSLDYLVACGIHDVYCREERLEVNGILISLSRECTDICTYGCRPKGFGINYEACANCCDTNGCNYNYPLSGASSISPALLLLTLCASCRLFIWKLLVP